MYIVQDCVLGCVLKSYRVILQNIAGIYRLLQSLKLPPLHMLLRTVCILKEYLTGILKFLMKIGRVGPGRRLGGEKSAHPPTQNVWSKP